jgi:hypothetical protein
MTNDVKEIRESQIRMEADLKYHIKRTDLLEQKVDQVDIDILKLKQPISFVEVLKISGMVSALVSSILVLLKYFKGI